MQTIEAEHVVNSPEKQSSGEPVSLGAFDLLSEKDKSINCGKKTTVLNSKVPSTIGQGGNISHITQKESSVEPKSHSGDHLSIGQKSSIESSKTTTVSNSKGPLVIGKVIRTGTADIWLSPGAPSYGNMELCNRMKRPVVVLDSGGIEKGKSTGTDVTSGSESDDGSMVEQD